MADVPHVIAYRVHPLTASVLRRLLKVRHVNLINLILGREEIPELLQERCTAQELTCAVERLWLDAEIANGQRVAFRRAITELHPGRSTPAERAARNILHGLGGRSASHIAPVNARANEHKTSGRSIV
jgi:lipid-A-disaccharide synthase